MLWSHLRLPSGKWFYGGNIARKNVESTWKKEENLDKSVGMTRMSKCGQHWGTRDGLGDTEKGHGLTQGAIVAHERSLRQGHKSTGNDSWVALGDTREHELEDTQKGGSFKTGRHFVTYVSHR